LQSNRSGNLARILLWSVAGLIVLLGVAFAFTTVRLPGCASCHDSTAFVKQSAARSHARVSCEQCHVAKGAASRISFAYDELFGMVLQLTPLTGGPSTAVPDANCLKCHAAVMTKEVTANGLSILHKQCAKGRMCVDCHADTAHGRAVKWITTVNMNTCLDCHNTDRVRAACDTCHVERSQQLRIRSGEWMVTHNANWEQTHGMGDLNTCAACHATTYCQRCHGIPLPHGADFIRIHPAVWRTNRKDCELCHKQRFCDSCHGLRMPHPAAFTPSHSKVVAKQGTTTCLKCHIQDDCTNCHVKHVHPGGAIAPPPTGVQ
jgi:hypothetical protein